MFNMIDAMAHRTQRTPIPVAAGSRLADFFQDESGATTIDWVVVTAAMIGLGFALMSTIGGATMNPTEDIAKCMVAHKNHLFNRPCWDYDKRMKLAEFRCADNAKKHN